MAGKRGIVDVVKGIKPIILGETNPPQAKCRECFLVGCFWVVGGVFGVLVFFWGLVFLGWGEKKTLEVEGGYEETHEGHTLQCRATRKTSGVGFLKEN